MTDTTLANAMAVLDEYRNRYPNSAYQTNVIEAPSMLLTEQQHGDMAADLTLEKLLDVSDTLIKSCKEKHILPKGTVLFSAKNYDITEEGLKNNPPLLKHFKHVAYRLSSIKMP